MNDRLQEIFEKIPVPIIFAIFIAYMGWDFYSFKYLPDSPMVLKYAELETVKTEREKVQQKAKALEAFIKSLEAKKNDLRAQAVKLDELKSTLSDTFDVPAFMQLTVTEAKKIGLTVTGLKPLEKKSMEYYTEQVFDFGFRGVYVQLLVFLHRLSQLQTIVRVENFNIKPSGNPISGYTQLEGSVQIKGYAYLRTKADEIAKGTNAPETAAAAPASTNKPVTPGGSG